VGTNSSSLNVVFIVFEYIGARFGSCGLESDSQDQFDEQMGDLMTTVLQDLDVAGAVDAFNIP
jgi:hypothetical protein